MYNGVIVVYKEAGFTSHDVVAKLRGILQQKKIGHTGTLDPAAVGVLPVCLGAATKLCEHFTDKEKEYAATMRLGMVSDTQDIGDGATVLAERQVTVSESEVEAAALSFLGGYWQTPPMYSALKVDGRKLYELARAGKEVERKSRFVEISELEILRTALPEVELRLVCAKGTYVRTLCHDIGEKLGCGAVMAALCRTRAGEFALDDALTLGQVEGLVADGRIDAAIRPVDSFFQDLPRITIAEEHLRLVMNGNKLAAAQVTMDGEIADTEQIRVYDGTGAFYGIYQYKQKEGIFTPVKMFLT
ncbi:MAG: tRNA pseudouridine(55) synthase TruB [Lachnospiraceae bacterium]|jgi:tRNA pseudouridine55 synthase|nr:tRNA pseudouridine(55) synthase TruB [Lachnospiraceae bacterium]